MAKQKAGKAATKTSNKRPKPTPRAATKAKAATGKPSGIGAARPPRAKRQPKSAARPAMTTRPASKARMTTNAKLDMPTLETWLWDAACAIRGAMDAPKFKDYILPLIFVKRLSDVYEDELARLTPREIFAARRR